MTSIEWLIEQIKNDHNEKALSAAQWMVVIEQAKEMHRIEHGKTWDASLDNLKARGMNEMRAYSDFDEYYSETLKKD